MHYTGEEANAIAWSFTALMLVILCLRLFTRFVLTRSSGWEDYCIAFSGVGCLVVATRGSWLTDVQRSIAWHSLF
jgi:hypothetical protein